MQLSYQVNQLEYGIQDVSWASGYQSSQWLTFLLPPTDAAIGTVDVPIPLRAYPVPPSVTGQQIVPFIAAVHRRPGCRAADAAATAALRLRLHVQHPAGRAGHPLHQPAAEHRAGRRDNGQHPANGLPAALAQYAAIRDGLEQDLALLTRVNPRRP